MHTGQKAQRVTSWFTENEIRFHTLRTPGRFVSVSFRLLTFSLIKRLSLLPARIVCGKMLFSVMSVDGDPVPFHHMTGHSLEVRT